MYAKLRLVSNLLASQRWTAVIPAQEFVNLSVETHSSGLLCAWICDWAGPKIDFFTNSCAGMTAYSADLLVIPVHTGIQQAR